MRHTSLATNQCLRTNWVFSGSPCHLQPGNVRQTLNYQTFTSLLYWTMLFEIPDSVIQKRWKMPLGCGRGCFTDLSKVLTRSLCKKRANVLSATEIIFNSDIVCTTILYTNVYNFTCQLLLINNIWANWYYFQ